MGLFQYKEKRMLRSFKNSSYKNFVIANFGENSTPKQLVDEVKPLDLEAIRSILFIYFVGITLSSMVLMLEIVVYQLGFYHRRILKINNRVMPILN